MITLDNRGEAVALNVAASSENAGGAPASGLVLWDGTAASRSYSQRIFKTMRTDIQKTFLAFWLLVCAMNSQGAVPPGTASGQGPVLEDCTGFDAYQQPADRFNWIWLPPSDEESEFVVSENFVDESGDLMPWEGTVSGLKWWGATIEPGSLNLCGEDDEDIHGTPFDITFYRGGVTGPGSIVATFSVTPAFARVSSFGVNAREFSALFPSIDVSGATWISIVRRRGVEGCVWHWIDENLEGTYDDQAHYSPEGIWPTDHALCLRSPGAGVDPVQATRDEMLRIGQAMNAYLENHPTVFYEADLQQFCIWSGPDFRRNNAPVLSHAQLKSRLVPDYLESLPATDAWGNPYEFRYHPQTASGFAILSPGADGVFEADNWDNYSGRYTGDPADDLVWAEWLFVRQPPIPGEHYRDQADEAIRAVGAGLRSWLVDQTGSPLPPPTDDPEVVLDPEDLVSHQEVLDALIPAEDFFYTRCVPEFDPWGRAYDYYIHQDLIAERVLALRTAGKGTQIEGSSYDRRPVSEPEADLVWSDGVYFREPALFVDGFESGDTSAWSMSNP